MASLSPSYFGRPQVTSTASCVVKRRPTCIDHLGIQVESREELSELAGRLKTAGAVTVDQADASCCYAKSDKSWVKESVRCELGDLLHLRRGDGLWRGHDRGRARRLFDIWHIQIILGEELDETGGDGGGIPARQVVARTRYRHRVDFWNPLLQ